MLHITNSKVAGFNVRWASFHGFSILFNNPGEHCLRPRSSKIYDLNNNVHTDSSLQFYKILDEGIIRLDNDFLTNQFLFCALPPTTYHVTLWGGLNIRHISQIDLQHRPIVESFLSDLPESLCDISADDILQLPSMSLLCTKRNWDINFCFDRLAIWNDTVLVAVLRPESNSVSGFEQLSEERRQLNKQVNDRFGVITDSEIYKPHVSLGYFANKEGAQKALDFVDDWNKWFNDALKSTVLSFQNASIYGLTDMITFFKMINEETCNATV
ncbi:hypothetical protein I4U23_015529 [Adineta vaga]|nr:hypothetical protein I4U23_015529 [Adineta vaga]